MEEKSKMFSWTSNDFIRSLTTSIFVAVIAVLYGLTTQGGFDLFSTDWGAVSHIVLNTTVTAFVARMAEKFLTASNGKVLGKIG